MLPRRCMDCRVKPGNDERCLTLPPCLRFIARESERAMADFVYRRQFTIEWSHCDPAGIAFNSRFFEFFDWGTWSLFEAALGVRPPELAVAFGIDSLPLVDASARFIAPA